MHPQLSRNIKIQLTGPEAQALQDYLRQWITEVNHKTKVTLQEILLLDLFEKLDLRIMRKIQKMERKFYQEDSLLLAPKEVFALYQHILEVSDEHMNNVRYKLHKPATDLSHFLAPKS